MCGIIGYTGTANAIPKMMKGLSVLEYRGYDSVGIAAEQGSQTKIMKCKGRISVLEEKLRETPFEISHCAIGHTRWATHGGPSDKNAHPHRVGAVTLVHNGIIENDKALRAALSEKGVSFHSETDTEVAAALINDCFAQSGDPVASIRAAMEEMKGSFAFAILFEGHTGEVFAARRGSPLILARGTDGYYLASDMTALLPFTKEYCALKENQIARLRHGDTKIMMEDGSKVDPEWKMTTMTPESAQKGGYSHFMLKEIHEQSGAAVKSVSPRIDANGLPDFSADGIEKDFWKDIQSMQIVACGSAMHAGLVGQRLIEDLAKIPVNVSIASEFRYHPPIMPKGSLVVLISQSGETADTLAALRYAKENGVPTLAIVNAVETTIAREADRRIYTYAGPEIAVATTKGYCTQATVLWLIAAAIALATNRIDNAQAHSITRALTEDVPAAIENMLTLENQYHKIARGLINHEHVFYIGRGMDYALSMEASLKLKEISYIHCEAYAAGELKHGTISLIEPGTPVLAICTEKDLFEKTESNIREVRSRGAQVTLICRDDLPVPPGTADETVLLPTTSDAATVFAAMLAIQYIAYETALLRGCDIDRPRNLAKSVTVE